MIPELLIIIAITVTLLIAGILNKVGVLVQCVFVLAFLPFLRLSAWGSGFTGLDSTDTVTTGKIILRLGTFFIIFLYLLPRIKTLVNLNKGPIQAALIFYSFAGFSLLYSSDVFYSSFRLAEHVGFLFFSLAILVDQGNHVDTRKAINLVLYACGMLVGVVWVTCLFDPSYAFRMLGGTIPTFGGHMMHIHTLGIIAAMIYGVILNRILGEYTSFKRPMIALGILLAMLVTVLLTRSRTSLIISVVLSGIIITNTRSYKIGLIGVIFFMLYFVTYENAVGGLFTYLSRNEQIDNLLSLTSRNIIWHGIVTDTWRNSPLIGFGYQMLSEFGISYNSQEYGFIRTNAHSTFVQTFAGLGLMGLLLLLWQIVKTGKVLYILSFINIKDNQHQKGAFELLLLFVGCIISSISEFGIAGMTTPVVPVYLIVTVYTTYLAEHNMLVLERNNRRMTTEYSFGRNDVI